MAWLGPRLYSWFWTSNPTKVQKNNPAPWPMKKVPGGSRQVIAWPASLGEASRDLYRTSWAGLFSITQAFTHLVYSAYI